MAAQSTYIPATSSMIDRPRDRTEADATSRGLKGTKRGVRIKSRKHAIEAVVAGGNRATGMDGRDHAREAIVGMANDEIRNEARRHRGAGEGAINWKLLMWGS
jgi:hypothetical protein